MMLLTALQCVLVLVTLLVAGAIVLRLWLRDGGELPPRVRKILSGFSRWVGIEFPERRLARVVNLTQRSRPRPARGSGCRRHAPGDRGPRHLT